MSKNLIISKKVARYLLGFSLLFEGFLLASTSVVNYQIYYKQPLLDLFSNENIVDILMALINSVFILSGIFTLSGNSSGLKMAVVLFVGQIIVIYGPKLFSFSSLLDLCQNLENILILVLGVFLALNLIHRLPHQLNEKVGPQDLQQIRGMLDFPITEREEAKLKLSKSRNYEINAIKNK